AGQNLRIPSPEDAIALATRFEKRKGTRPQTTSSASAAKKLELATNNGWSKNVTASEKKSFEKMASDINPAVVTGHLMVKRTYESKGKRFGIIQVEIGETLGHYADWLGVSTQRIRRLNGLRFGKGINLDERLVVPFHRTTRDEFEEKRFEYHKEFEEDFLTAYKIEGVRLYEIRKGDNIWSLCKESFDLPVWLVKKYNLTLNFNRLMPSQKLVVPVVERKNGLN
ncbi:MAG: LysM peptidoglycan-binding domain-containing protein, partial [Proteobacteria bacterium]|nr:LysM peptidoglycan-binding domain-containing protein [Pseudomonadota bacterium]